MKRTSLPPRATPLRRQSLQAARAAAIRRRAYELADDAQQCFCSVCGVTGKPLEHSHLFTQGRYKQHRANPLNWLISCRPCHRQFEDNKAAFAAAHPAVWQLILGRMEQLDPVAFEQFRMKHPY